MEAFRMIEAPSGSSGSAFCTVNRRPFTLTSKSASYSSSVIVPRGAYRATPALAKTMSSLPFSRRIWANRRSRSSRFDTSPRTAVTSCPTSLTAAASSGSRRPVMKTWAPSLTNRFAVARPMPLLPPVTRAVFPSSLAMSVPSAWNVIATPTRSKRSPNRLGDQLLQLAVEHGGDFRDAGIAELAEERGRPVVLDAGLPSLVLVDEHPQRGVEAGADVVLRHLDGEQGVDVEVMYRFIRLSGPAEGG